MQLNLRLDWQDILDEMIGDDIVEIATVVRDHARANARSIAPSRVGAIDIEVGEDALGRFADVGYLKKHPGFVLWWHEVGTSKISPKPHLRPAAAERII